MKINRKLPLIISLSVFLVLVLSYFIKLNSEDLSGNKIVDRLLGVLIFHNPFVLGIYILIIGIFIYRSFMK